MVDQPVVAFLQPGRADQDGLARGHGGVQIGLQRGRAGKVDQHVAGQRQGLDIAVAVDPARHCVPGGVQCLRDGVAHASRAADDADVGHVLSFVETVPPRHGAECGRAQLARLISQGTLSP
jgi:hypothetical protein